MELYSSKIPASRGFRPSTNHRRISWAGWSFSGHRHGSSEGDQLFSRKRWARQAQQPVFPGIKSGPSHVASPWGCISSHGSPVRSFSRLKSSSRGSSKWAASMICGAPDATNSQPISDAARDSACSGESVSRVVVGRGSRCRNSVTFYLRLGIGRLKFAGRDLRPLDMITCHGYRGRNPNCPSGCYSNAVARR